MALFSFFSLSLPLFLLGTHSWIQLVSWMSTCHFDLLLAWIINIIILILHQLHLQHLRHHHLSVRSRHHQTLDSLLKGRDICSQKVANAKVSLKSYAHPSIKAHLLADNCILVLFLPNTAISPLHHRFFSQAQHHHHWFHIIWNSSNIHLHNHIHIRLLDPIFLQHRTCQWYHLHLPAVLRHPPLHSQSKKRLCNASFSLSPCLIAFTLLATCDMKLY